jgi:TetR/AcrR family transcriptional repressor of nem operon
MIKAKKTRRYIIDKTAVIFNKKGFTGTSLSDLTQATGLTKGSIYGNFADKQEVAEAAFNFNYQYLIKQFATQLNTAASAKSKLHAFLDTYEKIFDKLMSIGGCPILNNAVDADDTNEAMSQLSVKAVSDWEVTIKSIIQSGKNSDEINDAVDVGYYTDIFISIIEGSLMLSKLTGKKRYFNSAIKHIRTITDKIF